MLSQYRRNAKKHKGSRPGLQLLHQAIPLGLRCWTRSEHETNQFRLNAGALAVDDFPGCEFARHAEIVARLLPPNHPPPSATA